MQTMPCEDDSSMTLGHDKHPPPNDAFPAGSGEIAGGLPPSRRRYCPDAVVSAEAYYTPAADDDQERRGRLLLVGEAAVLAHRLALPLAAELDDQQQRDEKPDRSEPRYRIEACCLDSARR
jgi:hypothetical protein